MSEPGAEGWAGQAEGGAAVVTRIGGALVVTLPRELSDATLASLRGGLMARLHAARARAIVFEASGLDMIDAREFADLSTVARSAAWLGVRPMLVGLSAGIVGYLVHTGVETSAFEPYRTLEDALTALSAGSDAVAAAPGNEPTP